jgi:hypothetical protein
MPDPVVALILSWSQVYRASADKAFDIVASAVEDDPSPANQLDYKQAVQRHSAVLNSCAALAIAAMKIISADAATTLGPIDKGTARLKGVLDKIAGTQRVMDILADVATAAADVVDAVTSLDPSKIHTAASELKTLVEDTIGKKDNSGDSA